MVEKNTYEGANDEFNFQLRAGKQRIDILMQI